MGCRHPYLSLVPLLAPLLLRLRVSEFELAPRNTPADLPRWTASPTHLGLTHTLPRDPTAALAALSALTLTHLAVGLVVDLGDAAIPVHTYSLCPRASASRLPHPHDLVDAGIRAHALIRLQLQDRADPRPPAAHTGQDVGRVVTPSAGCVCRGG
ncbi:hypothetical protein DFH08DRAFT_814942 [Mycena albidolilacea]|uniref:Secreted protein n=1 Tax=Mycena albidolilacea TaxID=1033008 RepID=A0AAD6ZNR6_9AGAR|nr:hypothetical protein DFH08DRAFT_814942 [Mycena albidolilacea]